MDATAQKVSENLVRSSGRALWTTWLSRIVEQRSLSLLTTIAVMFLVFSMFLPNFATFSNLAAVFLGLSFDGIIVVGMMICMVAGFFDLSVGSSVALSGAVVAYLLKYKDFGVLPALVIALGVAVLGGFTNGVITARVGVNPFITTLATMGILRGAAILIAGTGITFLPESFTKLGQSVFMGLQAPVWVMLVVAVIGEILLKHLRYFRQFYYVGANEKAAALSGMNVLAVKIAGFMIVAFLSGIAGVLQAARLGTAMSTAGQGQELRVITSAILGGASLQGGKGTVAGAILGTVFTALVSNAMILAGVSVYWQSIVMGVVLVIAVSLDVVLSRRVR